MAWIARSVGRTQHMAAEEARRNRADDPHGRLTIRNRNICIKRAACEVRRLCKTTCMAPCRKCRDRLCDSLRPGFECAPCPKLERTPFCCDSCNRWQGCGCSHLYRFYEAKCAQDLADARRSEAGSDIDCDPEAFEHAVDVIKDGLSKEQSPQHIIAANPDDIPFGARNPCSYLAGAKMGTLAKLDLPRTVRCRPRSKASDGGVAPDTARSVGRPPLVELPGA